MASDKNTRMHLRQSGSSRRSPGMHSAQPSKEAPPQPAYKGPERRTQVNEPNRSFFEKCRTQMGVAEFTLRRLVQHGALNSIHGLEKKVATAQLARMGRCGVRKVRQCEEKLRAGDPNLLDDYLLDLALKAKPIDTLQQMMEMNVHDARIREILRMVQEGVAPDEGNEDAEADVVEIVALFNDLLQRDVAFIIGERPKQRDKQIEEMHEVALTCIKRIKTLLDTDQKQAEQLKAPGRITAETMKNR